MWTSDSSRGELRDKITMSDQPGTIWGEIFVEFLVDLLKFRANFLEGRKLVYFLMLRKIFNFELNIRFCAGLKMCRAKLKLKLEKSITSCELSRTQPGLTFSNSYKLKSSICYYY